MAQWIKALSLWAWGPEFDPTSRQKSGWREPMMLQSCYLPSTYMLWHVDPCANINNKINIRFRITYVQVGSLCRSLLWVLTNAQCHVPTMMVWRGWQHWRNSHPMLGTFSSPLPNPWQVLFFCFMFNQVFFFFENSVDLELTVWYTVGWLWTHGYPLALIPKC